MSKQRTKVESLETTVDNHFLEIDVYYNLGGMNFFQGQTEPRGFWLSVSPVRKSRVEGNPNLTMTHTIPTDGARAFIEEAKRFSQKRLDQLVTLLKDGSDARIKDFRERAIARVLAKTGWALKSPEQTPSAV